MKPQQEHPGPAGARSPGAAPPSVRQPHLSGDLPAMFDAGPTFATAMRGYDRLQVDNYVAWAENELRSAQRLTRELVDRLAVSEAEAHRARQLMAESARDRDLVRLSDRVADLLRLAAQEAAATAQTHATDADQAQEVLAHAREEAEVVVRRARRLEARAAARLQAAERRLGEARTAEEQTRSRVEAMLQEAAEEQERVEAVAAARITQLQRELEELQSRRHRARQLLRELAGRVDAALGALEGAPSGKDPSEYAFHGNRAAPAQPAPAPDRPAVDRTQPVRRPFRRALRT